MLSMHLHGFCVTKPYHLRKCIAPTATHITPPQPERVLIDAAGPISAKRLMYPSPPQCTPQPKQQSSKAEREQQIVEMKNNKNKKNHVATRNKCIATSSKCLTSNKKLIETMFANSNKPTSD